MTTFYGEILSILTAMTWTVTALCADVASHRMGQLQMNVLRMGASLVILAVILWVFTGSPLPQAMNGEALAWLLASGAVGYVFGDYCLFTSYVLMGSRMGQLFMTLAPLFSALTAWLLLGETLSLQAIAGIVVTITGIGVVIRGKKQTHPQPLPSGRGAAGAVSAGGSLYLREDVKEVDDISDNIDGAKGVSASIEDASVEFTRGYESLPLRGDLEGSSPLPDGWLRGKDLVSLPKLPSQCSTNARRFIQVEAVGVKHVRSGWGWVCRGCWASWKWVFFGIGAGMGQGVGIVLSKVGMGLCEETPLLPMAATMVRAVAGFVGFGIAYYLRGDRARMRAGLRDRTTLKAATGTIIMGPVIGVSLSLLAVQMAPAGIASTLMALTPVFILWPSRWLFKQPITAREVIGSLIAVGGVALFFL
ncbi:MAG: DMT family transporter [Bacteroidaceae bacterium]|nr:DMT family transporter [Bacteroidaceae bacterium]